MKIIMRVVKGPEVGKEFVFPAEGESGDEPTNILVGRDDVECRARWRLSKDDRTVSRAHLMLEVRPPNCYVQDNGSLSKVFLIRGNAKPKEIKHEVLQDGDRLQLGATIVEFQIVTAEPTKTVLYQGEPLAPPAQATTPVSTPVAQPPAEKQPRSKVKRQSRKKDVPVAQQQVESVSPGAEVKQPSATPATPPSTPVTAPTPIVAKVEPPDPEWYCIRCGERFDQLPPLGSPIRHLDFMCTRCRSVVEEEIRLAEARSRERYACLKCGKDVTAMAKSDGRAAELHNAAVYLCAECGNSAKQNEKILGYWMIKKLGEGGIGEVYKVWDPQTGRLGAAKRLRPIVQMLDDKERRTLRRFHREIAINGDLRHPNVVRLYAVGEYRNSPVFVSEFVPGGDLLQFIDDNGRPLLPPSEVVRLIAASLEGLEYCHRKGYVHRDLKPENILLDKRNGATIPKIADFGFARSYEKYSGNSITTDGYAGTLMYMPPEQITDFRYLKPPADIYAMGVTIYFLLTGYWPLPDFPTHAQIKSGRVERLKRTPQHMILHDRRVPLEERRADLPRALCRVVNKAIAMKPEDRYQSAEEFRQALLQAL